MKIHFHSDHLGSASFVTNAEGAVVEHLQYLPYGELFVSQRNYSFALNTSLDVSRPHWEMICYKTSKPCRAEGFTLFERTK